MLITGQYEVFRGRNRYSRKKQQKSAPMFFDRRGTFISTKIITRSEGIEPPF